MNILLILLFIFVVIYSCVSWLLPALLSWLFKRKFHIKLKIGRIAVLKLILRDVSLSKDGYSIHIEEVSFRSSFFNSEINKLLFVVIKNLELTNNTEEKRSVVVETILKPLLSKQNSNSRSDQLDDEGNNFSSFNRDLAALGKTKLLDFRHKKLPPSLIMFAQFMGIHIFNATVIIKDTTNNAWSMHASASELHADGTAGGPAKALVFSANLVDATAKVVSGNRSLAEASCGVLIEGTVKADGPLNVEKIHTVVSNPTICIQDELYSFLQRNKTRKRKSLGYFEEDHYNTLLPRLSPAIPKIFSLKIDTTKISCADNFTNTKFETTVQSLQVNSRFSAASVVVGPTGAEVIGLPQVYVAFQMDQVQLIASDETLMFLNKLKLDAKLEKGVLNLYLIISILSLTYNHEHTLQWYTAWQRMKKSQPMQVEPAETTWNSDSWWARIACSCAVQGCAELRGVVLRAVRSSSPEHAARALSAGCSGLKVKLDQLLDTREEPYKWVVAQLVVGSRHWSAELLVDGGWARFGSIGSNSSSSGREPPPRRHHSWGSALLAVALVKWGTHGPRDSKIEAMMDCLRVEWSNAIAETVLSFVDCLHDYRTTSTVQPQQIVPESTCNIAVNVALSHINMFFIINDTMCVMSRIDAVTLEQTAAKSGAVVSGLKMVEIIPYQGNVHCQRSDEILSAFFHVKLARIEHVPSRERNSVLLDFQFLENVIFEWSANLHLKILTFVRAVKSFREELKLKRESHNDVVSKSKSGRTIDWRVSFKSETNLSLILSEDNNMLFTTDDMTIGYDHETGLSILWSQLKMVLNGDEIINMEGYSQERVSDDPDIRVERKANEGFVLPWNKVWAVNIGLVRVIFPYKHRWAEAVQGDFVSLFKWIKIIHGIKKKPFTSESPLPSDLHIKIDEIVIEMSDDPFEVKLRDNYELLEDEYKESQKRRIMLDAKVQELCKPHLFLPAGKVEELYAALRQKDAQIYVQRCRAAPPPRSRLVACCVSALRVMSLADPTMHGAHNATERLREMDADSPWPEDGIEFTTLWCRSVSVSCALWQLRLRDFPQPLLSMSELRLWGTLMAAEEQPPPRAVRTVTIEQGEPWGRFELERSMMPLKWYYDLCCEMTEYSYAFGPCWEPVIAHCNLAFDQVSRPSLDPSAPLAWWDKVRLLFHGRLTVNCSKFTCLLHVSLDPYNTTEEMEVTWSDLVLDWTNGKLGFLGELKVFVRTASKYDDCRVLCVPVLRLAVKMGWQCVGEPRDHHAVAPCAPTRLPEYSSNQEHDSYRAFRSQGVDLHLSMDTKPLDGDGPVLLLYGSTLRWFESLKLILSGTTRPTRRGRVFRNMRPRKPQLSRHYRNVAVSLTLHNLQVFYWQSSSMQRGIEMLGVRVTCGSRHRLSLVQGSDSLIRRARAVWATLYMNCDLNDAEIWLKTPAQRDSYEDKDSDENSSMLNPPAMEKCYCLSVRRVSYGREASGGCAPAPASAPAPAAAPAPAPVPAAPVDLSAPLDLSEAQDFSRGRRTPQADAQPPAARSRLDDTLSRLMKRKNVPAPEQITTKEKKRKKLDEIVLGLSAAKGQSPTSTVSYEPPRNKSSSVLPEVTVTPAAPPSSTGVTPPTQKPFSVTVTNVPSPHASSKELSSFLQQSLEQSNKPQKTASSTTPKPYSHEAKVNKWLAEQANVDTRRRGLPPRLAPDEHVPVVHRVTGKRLMGHKAPQLKHLAQWIAENPMYDIDSKWTEGIKEHVKLPQDVRNPRHSPMQPTSSVPERKKGRPPTLDSTSTNVLSANTHLNQNISGLNPALLASLSSLSAFDPKTLAATLSNLTGFDPKLLSSLSSFDPKNNPLLNSFNSMPNLLGNITGGNIFANLAGLGLPGFPSLDMNTLSSTSASTDNKSKSRKPAESSSASSSKSTNSQFPFVFPNPNMLYPQLGLSGLSPFGVHSGMSTAYDALGLLSGNLASSSSATSLHSSSHNSRSSSKTTAARSSTVTTTSSASRQQKVSDRSQTSHLPQILLPPDPYLLESLSKQTLNYEAALKAEKRSRDSDSLETAATDLSKAEKKKLPFDPMRSQMPPEFAAVQEKLLKGDKKDIDISKMLLEQMASGALSASLVSSTEAKKSKDLEKESYEKLGKPPEYLSRMSTDDTGSSISIAHKRTLDEISNEPENLAMQSISKKLKDNSSELIRNMDKRSDTTNTSEMDLEDLIAPSTVIKTGMKASDFEMNRSSESGTSLIVSNPDREDKVHQRISSPRDKESNNENEHLKKNESSNNVDSESREDNMDDSNVGDTSTDGGRKGIRKKGRKSSEESSLGPRRELRSSAGRQSTESINH